MRSSLSPTFCYPAYWCLGEGWMLDVFQLKYTDENTQGV